MFAGAGGLSFGFFRQGFRPSVAIDYNPNAVETLAVNLSHLGTRALLHDLASLEPEVLAAQLRIAQPRGAFDVIVGGPPCQGWSKVGRGKLKALRNAGRRTRVEVDPRNSLYKKFIVFVGYFRPQVAVMENVPGMLSHNGENHAESIAREFREAGYNVAWNVLNASHFGVPQSRERIFFVATRKELACDFIFPTWSGSSGKRTFPEVTVRDAIGDLPPIRNGARDWIIPYAPSKQLSSYARVMREGADASTLFDHVCRTQNAQDLEAFRLLKQGGKYRDLPAKYKRYRDDIFDDKYRKLYWDKPSWCVTAHLSRDCYSHIHPSQARTISIREAARLQSFPDAFYLAGNMGSKLELIGNAVPPLLAERLAEAIRLQIFSDQTKARRDFKSDSQIRRTSREANL